jgi:1-deoxy-D-xylulose-5-phosphate reductoisomerase
MGAVSMSPRGVAILGSTGSIGTTALRVLSRQRERFRVTALTAFTNAALLEEQAAQFRPTFVGLVQNGSSTHHHWQCGADCLVRAATRDDVDIVLNAVVGAAGLDATLAALEKGKRVALANKETLVMAGHLVEAARARGRGEIVPVDSEHSAILQCLTGRPGVQVRRVILTASGGPFRNWSADDIARATLSDALQHPTWRMGRKITVDSATLANKALEVIEAHFLFGTPYDAIDVVVHPQSLIHALVSLCDGATLAHLGHPDMRVPIAYALHHPDRVEVPVPRLDLAEVGALTFERPDLDAFPCLRLCREAAEAGGTATCVLNAANEIAVHGFLAGQLPFMGIPAVIETTLGQLPARRVHSFDTLYAADADARRIAAEQVGAFA